MLLLKQPHFSLSSLGRTRNGTAGGEAEELARPLANDASSWRVFTKDITKDVLGWSILGPRPLVVDVKTVR